MGNLIPKPPFPSVPASPLSEPSSPASVAPPPPPPTLDSAAHLPPSYPHTVGLNPLPGAAPSPPRFCGPGYVPFGDPFCSCADAPPPDPPLFPGSFLPPPPPPPPPAIILCGVDGGPKDDAPPSSPSVEELLPVPPLPMVTG